MAPLGCYRFQCSITRPAVKMSEGEGRVLLLCTRRGGGYCHLSQLKIELEDSKQMATLATALTSSKTEFSNELTYMPNKAPISSNKEKLEGGIQVLLKEDKETIELCRTMQQRGECPPLLVVFDSVEGFTVQADADIKDVTFITEYVGDVDYLEKRANMISIVL